jgi:hypothetical protein
MQITSPASTPLYLYDDLQGRLPEARQQILEYAFHTHAPSSWISAATSVAGAGRKGLRTRRSLVACSPQSQEGIRVRHCLSDAVIKRTCASSIASSRWASSRPGRVFTPGSPARGHHHVREDGGLTIRLALMATNEGCDKPVKGRARAVVSHTCQTLSVLRTDGTGREALIMLVTSPESYWSWSLVIENIGTPAAVGFVGRRRLEPLPPLVAKRARYRTPWSPGSKGEQVRIDHRVTSFPDLAPPAFLHSAFSHVPISGFSETVDQILILLAPFSGVIWQATRRQHKGQSRLGG